MSKYIFVGYDDSYLSLFSSIEKGILRENPNAIIRHIYIRPGAYFSAKIQGINALTPFFSRFFNTIKERDERKDPDLSFYLTSKTVNLENLLSIYDKYIQWIKKSVFENIDGTTVVMPGEYRLFEQALLNTIGKKKIQVLYFEAGPPGYIYLSKTGVNANADFSKSGLSSLASAYKTHEAVPYFQSIKKSFLGKKMIIFSKFVDLILYLFIGSFCRLGDHKEFLLSFYKRSKLTLMQIIHKNMDKVQLSKVCDIGDYYLFIGQVKEDVNSTHFGMEAEEIVKYLLEIVKNSDCKIVLRPHPLQGIDKEIKTLHTQFPLQFQYASGDSGLEENLINSNGVVTVNSNGGLEALLCGKPVLMLGRSYYESCYGVVKTVEELLKFDNSKDKVVKSASKFIDDCFIPVDYRLGNMGGAQIIGKMLERGGL